MKVLLVYCHPEPKSFNHALCETARKTLLNAGHEVEISDLYGMHFDPIVSRNAYKSVFNPLEFHPLEEDFFASANDTFAPFLDKEITKLEKCNLLILQFPIWWLSPPARLKGWIERVFVRGRIYADGCYFENALLRGKRALISVTTGAPSRAYTAEGMNGDIHRVLSPVARGMLEFIGFSVLEPNVVYAPAHMSDDEREQALTRYRRRLELIESEDPVPDSYR